MCFLTLVFSSSILPGSTSNIMEVAGSGLASVASGKTSSYSMLLCNIKPTISPRQSSGCSRNHNTTSDWVHLSLSLSLSHWFILRSHLHHLHLSTYLQATVGHHVSILPNEAGAMGTPPRPPSIHRPDQYDRAHGTHGRLRKEPRNPVDLV